MVCLKSSVATHFVQKVEVKLAVAKYTEFHSYFAIALNCIENGQALYQ
jgi:hypothetical protein